MEKTIEEPRFRLNRKVNFKGEKAYEYTVRGDTIEELIEREKEIVKYLNEVEK